MASQSEEKRERKVRRVLIVDDMRSLRAFYRALLKDTDYLLDEASDGAQAVRKCMGNTPPDLVFLDIMMPGMNGIETCQHIKERRKDIAVVIVSNKKDRVHVRQAQEAGCDCFLAKPVNRDELIQTIDKLLNQAA